MHMFSVLVLLLDLTPTFGSPIHAVAYSADGKYLAVGGDRLLNIWKDQRLVFSHRSDESITGVAFGDGVVIVATRGSSSIDREPTGGSLTVYKLDSWRKQNMEMRGHISVVAAGKYVATAFSGLTGPGVIYVYHDGKERHILRHDFGLVPVGFSKDGARLLAVTADGKTHLYDMTTGSMLRVWRGSHGAIRPDGEVVAFKRDFKVVVSDVKSGKEMVLPTSVSALCFSPNGKALAGGTMDERYRGTVTFWSTETGKVLKSTAVKTQGAFNGLAFSPDGKTLTAGGFSGKIIQCQTP